MTNSTFKEVEELWLLIKDHVSANWNVGRGRKHNHKPEDVMVMALSALKCGELWDVVSQSYNMAPAVFEKLVSGFIDAMAEHLYKMLVIIVPEK